MKKKILILVIIFAVLAVLFVPVPTGAYEDGGTTVYQALTYKIINWNRITGNDIYKATSVYFFPDNFKSVDSLFKQEIKEKQVSFKGTITQIAGTTVTLEPFVEEVSFSYKEVSFSIDGLRDLDVQIGSGVEVFFLGDVMETYPAQIFATDWKLLDNLRNEEYTQTWIDKSGKEKEEANDLNLDLQVIRIYDNCFFAKQVLSAARVYKINGKLDPKWCEGDRVSCEIKNSYYDNNQNRAEADLVNVRESSFQMNASVAYKPVIYLYPQKEINATVSLSLNGKLTCAYPKYEDIWSVTAKPDGTLTDKKGQTYNYLYWEGELECEYDFSKGFCVKGDDTAEFLETTLEKLGLNRKEANEFIVYWLPQMQENPYNIISFQTNAYTGNARLNINPAPDTLIRVFMAYKPVNEYQIIEKQELAAPERDGFVVVEWGGAEVK